MAKSTKTAVKLMKFMAPILIGCGVASSIVNCGSADGEDTNPVKVPDVKDLDKDEYTDEEIDTFQNTLKKALKRREGSLPDENLAAIDSINNNEALTSKQKYAQTYQLGLDNGLKLVDTSIVTQCNAYFSATMHNEIVGLDITKKQKVEALKNAQASFDKYESNLTENALTIQDIYLETEDFINNLNIDESIKEQNIFDLEFSNWFNDHTIESNNNIYFEDFFASITGNLDEFSVENTEALKQILVVDEDSPLSTDTINDDSILLSRIININYDDHSFEVCFRLESKPTESLNLHSNATAKLMSSVDEDNLEGITFNLYPAPFDDKVSNESAFNSLN
jgi:hypothetical protein